MEAVAHNPSFAKKVGIPSSVGKHFHEADKGRKFGKGGEMKHANELHGKAKETKSIAKEEMKALKRGHAPKEIMEHERAEHKAMGYKHGGGVKHPHPAKVTKAETHQKGFAMAESKGGRKPPHGKHDSEGDTKLKGFGMGKGMGHGRSVSRAKEPKEEMGRKGFAMKKGGHVKHHKKRMADGGMAGPMSMGAGPMRRPRPRRAAMPGLPPQAMAALGGMGAGPSPGAGAPPPTMGAKKGGHVHAHHGHHGVHHHTHHHYAKGGSVRPGIDEKAERGHTKGKQVKMASGGHVGSHPSRRADGAAQKGHTNCKIR